MKHKPVVHLAKIFEIVFKRLCQWKSWAGIRVLEYGKRRGLILCNWVRRRY